MRATTQARVVSGEDGEKGFGWRGLYRDLPREHGFERLEIEGKLPADLQGTLYRNGPALFSTFGRPYEHPFDGDGAITAIRFSGGRAEGAVRLVASEALRHERAAGRAMYRGFGTNGAGLHRFLPKMKNAANTNVIYWNERLLALWEGGRPTELRAEDLETLGETSLEGAVRSSFSAHPHSVPARRTLFNFGVRYGRETKLDLFALPEGGRARRLGSIPLRRPTMLHDFIVTEKHFVFFVSPVRFRVLPMLLGIAPMAELCEWEPARGTEVIVAPLDAPADCVRFRVDSFYQWHYANAFEKGAEIVVDFVKYDNLDSLHALRRMTREGVPGDGLDGTPHRARIDPARKTLRLEPLSASRSEFPRVHPEREGTAYRFAYGAGYDSAAAQGMHNALVKLDVESGREETVSLGEEQYPSEAVFVPRAGARDEDDGYLLSLVYDAPADRSHLAVLDAKTLGAGPLARAWFDHPVPVTFHGNFAPGK